MISAFPSFLDLSIDLKEEIEKITSDFPPYSDFNFVSLWCWNLTNKTQLSLLNDNLVIRMEDYTTADIFYMFIGQSKIKNTIEILFKYLESNNEPKEIYLIPEEIIKKDFKFLNQNYSLEEDRDNFDYILSVEKLTKMEGRALHQKRKLLNSFLKKYSPQVEVATLSNKEIKKQALDFFAFWKKQKGDYESKNEEIAFNKLFELPEFLNIYILTAYIDKKMLGFSVFEILDSGYAVGDFQKADNAYKGAYEFINFSIARFLNEKNVKHYNIEQDLGIEGLRRAKLDYDPVFFKKFTLKSL